MQIDKSTNKQKLGFTLIEILVVVSIFAVLGVLITRSILLTIGGSKKSENLVKLRENLNYSVGVIERQIRNANGVDCTNADPTILDYTDQYGDSTSFSCTNDPQGIGYIASGSATIENRLTGDEVDVTNCSFVCNLGASGGPSVIMIDIEAQDAGAAEAQGASVRVSSQVSLRNYE